MTEVVRVPLSHTKTTEYDLLGVSHEILQRIGKPLEDGQTMSAHAEWSNDTTRTDLLVSTKDGKYIVIHRSLFDRTITHRYVLAPGGIDYLPPDQLGEDAFSLPLAPELVPASAERCLLDSGVVLESLSRRERNANMGEFSIISGQLVMSYLFPEIWTHNKGSSKQLAGAPSPDGMLQLTTEVIVDKLMSQTGINAELSHELFEAAKQGVFYLSSEPIFRSYLSYTINTLKEQRDL